MTYEYVVVNDRPSAAFALDYQPFRDFSGNGIFAGGQRVKNLVSLNMLKPTVSTGLSNLTPTAASVTLDSDFSYYGFASHKVTVTTASPTTGFGYGIPIIADTLSGSKVFTGGMMVAANFNRAVYPYVVYASAGGGTDVKITATSQETRVTNPDQTWRWIQGTFSIPAGATNIRFGTRCSPDGTATNDAVWMTGYIFVEQPSFDITGLDFQQYAEIYEEDGFTILHRPVQLAPSLVSGGGSAALVNSQSTLDINYVRPTGPFSVEAWFKPVLVTDRITIADGIEFDGEAIYFFTEHQTGGRCEAVYFPPIVDRVFHVVGIHDNTSNRLWVDGIEVAEAEMTPEQISSPYVNTEVVPSGTGAGSLIVDGLAFYDRVISSNVIVNHYFAGTRAQDYKKVVATLGGSYWTLSDSETNIALDLDFGNWDQGIMSNVLPESGVLRPEVSDLGVTYGGSWAYGLPLNTVGQVIDGSRILWDGDGSFVVQTSMDDELTWQTAVNGREVEGLSGDFNTEGKSLSIRIVFSTGEPADHITAVRRLRVTLYASRDMINSEGAQYAQPIGSVGISDGEYPVLEKNAHMGVDLYNGSLVITPRNLDETDGGTSTVEMWMDWEGVDGSIFESENAYLRRVAGQWEWSGLTIHLNGSIAYEMTLASNVWTHVALVLDNPTTDAYSIHGPARIGMLATYRTALDSADIGGLYNNYLGIASVSLQEESVIGVTDSAVLPRIYAYNWSIVSVA